MTRHETYTPGPSRLATDFMARRTLESHGAFFIPFLAPGVSVLDCACGPGSIARGIARRVAPARVVGVDLGAAQVERAIADAAREDVRNVSFMTADCYALPFENAAFDRVFSHALMEHLADPARAMRELHRVLKPGGVIGVCSPDWGGFLLAPPSQRLDEAVSAYTALQSRNGGDVHVGRKLGTYLVAASFADVRVSARYECPPPGTMGELLAQMLEASGDERSARTFRTWSVEQGAMFALAWVQCIATRR